MVLKQWSVAKGLGVIVSIIIFIVIIGVVFFPLFHVFERGATGTTFGFPSSSNISNLSFARNTAKHVTLIQTTP